MRISFVSFVLGLALMACGPSSAMAAPASVQRDYETPWQPFEALALNNCNGEMVAVTGEYLLHVQTVELPTGGVHVTTHYMQRSEGVGLVTGVRYASRDQVQTEDNYPQSGTITVNSVSRGVYTSTDPTVPSLRYRVTYHFTINANGEMTSQIDRVVLDCD